MKGSSIRKIDDLGRVVIPREIRDEYHLITGDTLDFYTENGKIIIEKHDDLFLFKNEIRIMCDILRKMDQNTVFFIPDQEKVPKQLDTLFEENCRTYHLTSFEGQKVYRDDENKYSGYIVPITNCGIWYGAFVILQNEDCIDPSTIYIAEAFAQLLSQQQGNL